MDDLSREDYQQLLKGYDQMPLLWQGRLFELSQFNFNAASLEHEEHIPSLIHTRLGKVAEELFAHQIHLHKDFKLIFKNLAIRDHGLTLGELDFCIQKLTSANVFHVEITTKFYLYHPAFEPDDINAWIGPNRNDSLAQKVRKLRKKQLPILHTKEAKSHIKQLYNLDTVGMLQHVYFKAWLFVPLHSKIQLKKLNPEAVRGYYMPFTDFMLHYKDCASFFCPKKIYWLKRVKDQNEWYSLSTVLPAITKFMEAQQSIMVWVKSANHYESLIITPYVSL